MPTAPPCVFNFSLSEKSCVQTNINVWVTLVMLFPSSEEMEEENTTPSPSPSPEPRTRTPSTQPESGIKRLYVSPTHSLLHQLTHLDESSVNDFHWGFPDTDTSLCPGSTEKLQFVCCECVVFSRKLLGRFGNSWPERSTHFTTLPFDVIFSCSNSLSILLCSLLNTIHGYTYHIVYKI